jgi:hypothetical protein
MIFFEKWSESSEEKLRQMFVDGYSSAKDDYDEYFFDPKHWKLVGVGEEWDFKYGKFYFKSQTIEAKELAIMDGYGKCQMVKND